MEASKNYYFREDYVSNRLPVWEEHLLPLKGRPGLRFLEIGCFEGRGTIWFLENLLTAPDSTIVCVDNFGSDTEETYDRNIAASGVASKVVKIKRRSDDYLASNPADRFDLIYVDADHRAASVLLDGMLAFPLVKFGGLLMFDDYGWLVDQLPPHERPQLGVDICLEALAGQYDLVHKGYQVIIHKRIP
jgi:predicted O-methyltransferase YrrM